MKTPIFFLKLILATTVLLLVGCAATQWNSLNKQVESLYQNGHYDQALVVQEKALEIAEKAHGPNHPDVALSLNNLARLYQVQGWYEKAEPLFMRSLAIVDNQ